ncbi:unnamed protein product [Phytophthora fragariaefolia]|uniref:Unnamed protein product n=1 Tax=Phytophthora fragariaefolia TaxID=1490495 RepID=A0A9W6Y3V6_9STRA|nr:unnamed protein product [Phytophthora fragariaefolia]
MGLYHVGTVRPARLGWCPGIQYKQKKRPKTIPRGQYRITQSKPYLVALAWMDSRPVNMIATGCSTYQTTVNRREKDGTITVTPCPQLVVDYARGMGGADMAIVNGVIVHNLSKTRKGEKPTMHVA